MVIADTGQVADLVFVIEGTANMGAYLGELKANYIVPTLECFNGGPAEDKECGSELTSTLYALIVFMAADAAPEPSVTCGAAPTTSISKFLSWLDRVPFLGGAAEGCSHIVEGLGTALQAFDDFQSLREPHLTTQKHCILVCNSPPYPLPCVESNSYLGLHAEQLANLMGERGINLSIISPRKIPALFKLYDKAGGDLQLAQNKNYTKDRRHLVLLKGYQLQERPLSPASAEMKDKPQLSVAPQITSALQSDKPLITSNSLSSAGSPGPNTLIQPQPKGPVASPQIGKKRPPGGSPPNQPPFKQPVTMQQGLSGNLMSQVGLGPQALPQPQKSLQGPPLMSSQPQSLASTQPPMSSVQSSMPNPLNQMHIGVSHQKQNPQIRPTLNHSMGGISHPGQIPSSQPAQSFMNQPNPPNVTITKGPPMPVIPTQSINTSVGRPIRDQTPMNQGGLGSRMTWNPPSGPGGMPQQNAGSTASQMSQLVMRLKQPTVANPNMMLGPRPSGVDPMNTRPPNVTAPGALNSSGPGNVLGVMSSGNIGQGGPNSMNQAINMPSNVGPGGQNLPSHLNMGHPPMGNPPSALQNQLGAQRLLLLQPGNTLQHIAPTSMTGNQPQIGSQPITSMASGQSQPNIHSSLGNMVQPSLPGVMNQQNNMPSVGGPGPLSQQQQVSQPQSQPQALQPGQQLQPSSQKERRFVWQGVVEWQEKPKMANDPTGKINRQVQCQVSSALNNIGEPEVNADKWPKKLIMQLIPKILMQHFGSAFLKMSRNVIFHFNNNMETVEALGNLNKVMSNGFIGCVHFSPHQNANCDIRILMLIYSTDKHTYVGFIPNDQTGFVAAIRNVITRKQQSVKQQQAAALQQHMFGPQGNAGNQQMTQMNPGLGPNMTLPMGGSSSAGGPGSAQHGVGSTPANNTSGGPSNIPTSIPGQVGPAGGSSGQGVSGIGGINSVAMQQTQQPGLMVSHANPASTASGPPGGGQPGTGGGGAAGGPPQQGSGSQGQGGNLEAQLAAERQQNLLKIQQLQQSLEAAQQKDMRLKAAQEHQKQQIVHPVRQPSDILLHVGGNTSSANNPQLRHLLQLQQQQQLLLQQQVPGQRPQMTPGQMGQPGMGQGPGPGHQQQPQNSGGNIFGDDMM